MSDPLLELEELLPQLPAAIERRRIGESLGKAAEELRDAPQQIQRFSAVLDIARETAFASDTNQAAAMEDLLECAVSAAKLMSSAQTADQLRSVQDGYKEFTQALRNLDRQLRPHWSRVVDRDFGPLCAIGSLLEKIDGTAELGRRLTTCGRNAQKVGDKISAEDLRDVIARLHQERNALEIERASVTKDPETDRFLNALAEGKATLRLVTPRVQAWLEQNGALDQFTITARS
jgi:hypothetical protein